MNVLCRKVRQNWRRRIAKIKASSHFIMQKVYSNELEKRERERERE